MTIAVPDVRFSAAVIAGGASRRMGTDKAFVPWNGTTLLDHQLATLRALNPAELLISGRSGVDYGVGDARIVLDTTLGVGPLAGLLALLRAAQNEHVVVLAVDMPFVTTEFLRGLLRAESRHRAVVPRVQDCWEPFAAVYPRSMAALIESRLSTGDRSLQALLDRGCAAGVVEPVAAERADLFESLNTPESHRLAAAAGRRDA